MALIIITAVMEVSVIIISCILYHCICIVYRKRKAKMDFTRQRRKNEENGDYFFLEYANAYYLLKCHVTYLLIDKVG